MAKFPPELADNLRSLAKAVRSANRRQRGSYIEIGRCAAQAQALLSDRSLPGLFAHWCKECELTRSEAYRAIAVFSHFGECRQCQHQPTRALIILTQDDRAALVGKEHIERGERLTIKKAREILARFKAPAILPVPKPAATIRNFATADGFVSVRLNVPDASRRQIAQNLTEAVRLLQEEVQALQGSPEPIVEKKRGWLGGAA